MRLRLLFGLLSVCLVGSVFAQMSSNEIVEIVAGVDVVNEFVLWGVKSSLWIWGGVCGLICAVCFFARS